MLFRSTWSLVKLNDYLNNYEQVKDGLYLEGQGTTVTEVFTKTSDDFNVVLDSRPFPVFSNDTIVIPIWIKVPTNGPSTHRIMLDGIENLPSDYSWYIKYRSGFISTLSTGFDFPTGVGKNYIASIYIYKKPMIVSGIKIVESQNDLGELIMVYDEQGRVVNPDKPGYYIFVYKTKENGYIRKLRYIY